MRLKGPFLVLVFCFTPLSQAYLRLKLKHWFPHSEQTWITAAASCQQQLEDYWLNNRTRCAAPCACAASCILENIPATTQSNFASAQVLLGLLPTILGFFGPTIAEVSALSTYKPLLAVTLALGSPAIHVVRILRRIDLNEPFTRPLSRSSHRWPRWVLRQKPFLRSSFWGLSYVAAVAAIANNVWISVYTDLRTIMGWRCGVLFMPLAWGLAAVFVHALGMIAIRIQLSNSHGPFIRSAVKSTIFQIANKRVDCVRSEILLWVASFCAVIHLTIGVLVLSSLVFISATEAFQVFLQYALSAVVCKIIMNMELANMRYDLETASDSTQAGLRMA